MIAQSSYKYMRLLVLFDLPMVSKEDVRRYNKFRKAIMDDGFLMIQFSVYSRFCRNQADATKHINRVRSYSPEVGNIRMISITEKQFEDMIFIIGVPSETEMKVNGQMTMVIE